MYYNFKLFPLKEIKVLNYKGDNLFVLFYLFLSLKVLIACLFMGMGFIPSAILTSMGFILVVSSFSYLFANNKRLIYLLFINFTLSLILLMDCTYFNYFQSAITVYTFKQTANLKDLAYSILAIFNPESMILLIDLPLAIFIIFTVKTYHKPNRKFFLVLLVLGILMVSILPLTIAEPFRQFDSSDYLRFYGPLGHHALDLISYVKDRNVTLSDTEKVNIEKWFLTHSKNNQGLTDYNSIGQNKNLIVIQVESLQNFVINKSFYNQEITPNINSILNNSIYFKNFFPQTIEGNSSDAELVFNTSLYPVSKGSTFFRFPCNTYNYSLANLLKAKGYNTYAVHGDEKTFWNRNNAYPGLGFDEFWGIESFDVDEQIGMGLSDYSMFKQLIGKIKNTPQPFYVFVITLTSHIPFKIPQELQQLDLPVEMEDLMLVNYLQSIKYTDAAIGYFMEALRKEKLLDNSIIAIYGDHDGIFKDNKTQIEAMVNQKISDEEWIRNYSTVPFIVYNPSICKKDMDVIGGQVDALPTLASVMGISKTEFEPFIMGQNLFTTNQGFAILPKGDYEKKEVFVTKDEIKHGFNKEQKEYLNYSELIIKSNFFSVRDF